MKTKSLQNEKSISGILHSPISDHYGAFTSLNFNRPTDSPRYVTVHKQDEHSLLKFRDAISSLDLVSKVNSNLSEDPNNTYAILESEITKTKERLLPSKRVRFNKYKHKKNNWITTAIMKSIHHRDKLYNKLKSFSKSSETYKLHKINFNEYDKLLNKLIREAKTMYYNSEFQKHQNDIKRLGKP